MPPVSVQDESIYNLIPQTQEVPQRPPRHKSTFVSTVDPKNFEFGQSKAQLHQTFGLPNGCNSKHPGQYLRKHEKEPVLPDPKAPTTTKLRLKAHVPSKDEQPVFGLTSNKNFITTNAVDVILAKPKRVPQDEFNWTSRPGYGKAPVYLRRNKERAAAEKEQFETYLKMRHDPAPGQAVSQLSQGERGQLLKHLKLKWASVNDGYQKLSLSVDSEMKKRKKEELERTLGEIEKDIKTLEHGELVLVMDE